MVKMIPWQPAELEPEYGKLDLEFRVSTPSGWLFLTSQPYRLHADCFSETSGTMRKSMATSEYLAGEYVVNAIPGLVTETVAVWVEADSPLGLHRARAELIAALTQIEYVAVKRVGDVEEIWRAQAADWTVNSPKELTHATRCIVRASVPRHPNATYQEAT